MDKDTRNLLLIGALGAAGIYAIKKLFDEFGEGAKNIGKAASKVVEYATRPGDVTVKGGAVLPSGIIVPMDKIFLSSDMTFSYGGVKYEVLRRIDDKNYETKKVLVNRPPGR